MVTQKRILLLSDIHLCDMSWYGWNSEERIEKLISDIIEENKRQPVDLILFLGDYSLDFWMYPPYGSYIREGLSNTKIFIKNYFHRLPCPAYIIPGNHEQYAPEDWKSITGFERKTSVVLGNYVFILLDNFGENLGPKEHSDGTYSFSDISFLKSVKAKNPGNKLLICAHWFDCKHETEEFKQFISSNEVLCLFAGHTHQSSVVAFGDTGKYILQTGHYSYSGEENPTKCLCGYRELIINETEIVSRYITPKNDYKFGNAKYVCQYTTSDELNIKQ